MPTKKMGGYLLVLLGATVFYYAYYGWFAGFLLWLLILLPVLSLLISLRGMLRTSFSLSAPDKAEEKAAAALTLTLRTGFGAGRAEAVLSLFNLFTCQTAERVRLKHLREIQTLPFDTGRCGCVKATVEKVFVCDLLGLFRLPVKKPAPVTLTVLPRPTLRQSLPDVLALAAQLQPLAPRQGGGMSEEYEYREYAAGDPVRTVHWKLTAKMGKPIVRETMAPRGGGLTVTLDPYPDAGETMAVLRRVTDELIVAEIPFTLRWEDNGAERDAPVTDRADGDRAMYRLLSTPVASLGPAGAEERYMRITHEGVLTP